MDNPGLSHVQTSPVQPNAASDANCSRNQQKFSLTDVHEQTVQNFVSISDKISFLHFSRISFS